MSRWFFSYRLAAFASVTAALWVLSPAPLGSSLGSASYAAPSPAAPDALLENQWHLKDRSVEVGGANVRAAWPSSTGAGVVIGIVDDGVQYAHPDISPNYLASASWDFNFNDADPQPFSTSAHGTAVAGVAAARGDNTIGVSGAAPQASIAALRLTAVAPTDSQEAAAFGFQPDVIDVLNNSWNPTDNGTTLKGPGPLAASARQSAITTGRQGKGRIFVWSSGNGRLVGDDCNYDGYANSRFAIAVGASTDAANQVTTSEGCSALMVLAPAAGTRALTTTDLMGSAGYDSSDFASNFGTSTTGGMNAAAPTVSGTVALMLARNPNLTWRDVQHILRRTSVRILPTDPGWTSGQFKHNERLGFGLLDAEASVDMAGTWTNVPAEEVLAPPTKNVNQAIPDINQTGINSTISISSSEANFVIEHVEVDFNATHTWRGDLQVKLTSPSGVVSTLAPIRPSDGADNYSWKFGSVRHWGETANGVWTLNVADKRYQDTGTWTNWTLRIYGYHTAVSAPGAFAKSSPSNGAAGQPTSVTLDWGSSAGAADYEYCYDATNDGACAIWTSVGTATSAVVSGLVPGATYYWQVRATNETGATYAQGSASAFWAFTTAAPPGAFVHSSPSNGAAGQSLSPTLSWTPSSGASSYEYCYDTSNNSTCNATWISNGASTSVALSGLAANTAYSWHVRALNTSGAVTYADGAATTFWNFTTLSAPGAFSHVSPADGATGQSMSPTLTWSTSSGATSYSYCYDTTNDGACSNWISNGASTSAGLSGLAANTTYYWHARATNSGGTTYADGAANAFSRFTTMGAPGAFSHVSPSNGATGASLNPTIDWSDAAGATTYEYCYDTSNNGACNSGWIPAGSATSASLSGLAAGTLYSWHVRATNAGGTTYAESSASAFWTFTTVAAPGAFSHLSPSNGATGQALNPTLDWSNSSGAASYEFCFDASNDNACANWTNIGANTSINLSGLAPGTQYFWHVRATNGGGTSYADGAATAFWSFTTLAAPGAFSHSSPANGAINVGLSPTLSWNPSSNATSYEYCIDTTNDGACSGWIGTGANTSVALSNLAINTAYYWQVRALNANGTTYAEGSASSHWTFTSLTAPSPFNRTSPANGASGLLLNPTLSWQSAAGAASYEYCYDTTNDGACANWISAGANTSAALGGLAAGTPYFWQVRATNVAGTTYASGGASSFWSFTTMPAPVAFNMSSPANGATGQPVNPTLSWSPSPNATSFEYCIDTTNDSACSNWISTGTSTSVALSNLPNGTAHYWHVRAVNAVATVYAGGSASSFWNFTTIVAAPGAFSHTSPVNGATALPNNPTLSWGASAGATNYEYCIDTTNDNACSGWTPNGTSTSVALSNLAYGTPHYWQVRAVNAGGTTFAEGSASSYWTFTTQVAVPAAFNRSSPANGATDLLLNATLSWAASTGATSYQYCLDTTNDGACANWISTGTSTSAGVSLTAGTAYFWQVRAINVAGTTYAAGGASSFWSFTTMPAPLAFNMSSPANGATGQPLNPTLSWSPSPNTTTFEYCLDTTNDNACSGWTANGTNTSVGVAGLAAGTTYYWHVRAVNGVATVYAGGSATAFRNFTTQAAAPGAFSHTSPANGATGQSKNPNLSWGASAGATGYEYCIDTSNNNNCSNWTSTGTNTGVALTGLSAGTTYYWHVRAANASGTTYAEGASTAFWSFTTQSPPGAFNKSNPVNGASGVATNLTVSWAASTGASSYEICYDTSNDGSCSGWTNNGANTSADISGLTQGTTYYWQVRATNAGGMTYAENNPAMFWTMTTQQAAPGAFGHTSPSNGALKQSTSPTLSWSASSGAAGYEYCIDLIDNAACDSSWIGTGTELSAALSGLAPGAQYFWQVRAVNAGGTTYAEGAAAAFWSFTTKTTRKAIVDLNGDGNGDVFTYDPASGAWARHVSQAGGGFNTTNGSWSPGWTVTAVNFNTDTLTDFFLFNPQSGQWFKMLNDGTGFTSQAMGSWWQGWERYVMDLDGDGITDMFLYDPATGTWFKAASTSNGFNYTQGGWNPGWEIYPMTLNSDDIGDMFLINRVTGRWFWVLGDAGGDFTYPVTETWFPGWNFHPGDFNGDGLTDILLHDAPTGVYFVATANASGFSYQQGGWSTGWAPMVGDFDADGAEDLFLHDPSTGVWFEMVSNGNGNFNNGGGQTWSLGWQLHPTDVNGDGRTDVVLYDPLTGAWYQARNTALGSFSYSSGTWAPGLTLVVRPPIR